jgi:hypothetical protein
MPENYDDGDDVMSDTQEIKPVEMSEAMSCIISFMEAWKNMDYEKMASLCQLSWYATVPGPVELLKAMFVFKPLRLEVIEGKLLSDIVYSIEGVMHYEIARGVTKKMKITGRVIREKAPLEPAPDGKWGVNPITFYVF